VTEIAEAIRLEPICDNCKQQMPRQMSRGRSPEDILPARTQSPRDRDRAKCAISSSIDVLVEGHDHCDVSSASLQAACWVRSAAAGEALPSLIRYTRPLSVCSETRLRLSFLRTTPAKKAAHRMLLPIRYSHDRCDGSTSRLPQHCDDAGVFGIGVLRLGLDDADADRLRDTGLAVFRAVDRAVAFGLDLDLFMGSSEVCATPSARTTSAPPG